MEPQSFPTCYFLPISKGLSMKDVTENFTFSFPALTSGDSILVSVIYGRPFMPRFRTDSFSSTWHPRCNPPNRPHFFRVTYQKEWGGGSVGVPEGWNQALGQGRGISRTKLTRLSTARRQRPGLREKKSHSQDTCVNLPPAHLIAVRLFVLKTH